MGIPFVEMLRSTVRRRGEALPAPPNSSHWQPEMFVQWSPLRCDSPPNPLPPFVFCSSHILTPSNRLRCICRNIPLRLCCNLARTPVLTRSPFIHLLTTSESFRLYSGAAQEIHTGYLHRSFVQPELQGHPTRASTRHDCNRDAHSKSSRAEIELVRRLHQRYHQSLSLFGEDNASL